MHRLRTRLSVVVRLTRWFLRRSLTLCARCDSHAERAGQVFCSRMGLCFGECPARMLSWKLRILTPTMSLSLLLSGCSHRRKGKLELGYSSPAWIDSLSPLSLLSLNIRTLAPTNNLPRYPPIFVSNKPQCLRLSSYSPWMAVSCEPVHQLQLSSFSKNTKPSFSHMINNKWTVIFLGTACQMRQEMLQVLFAVLHSPWFCVFSSLISNL